MWQRNNGKDKEEKLQNRFTVYLVKAAYRRKKDYIHMKNRQRQFESYTEDCSFKLGLNSNLYEGVPLPMQLENSILIFALRQLGERERYVLFAHVLDEKSFEELGNELGLSYKGVAAVYYRAIKKIKDKMRRGKMDFYEILLAAKAGDMQAQSEMLKMYQPLLMKDSIIDGYYDEDLYQELSIILLKCISQFSI